MRATLESRRRALMDAGTWDNTNDPDNHFIGDDVLRSLVNDKNEIKVGSSIYVILDEKDIIEFRNNDWNALYKYRSNDQTYIQSTNYSLHTVGTNTARGIPECTFGFTVGPATRIDPQAFNFSLNSQPTPPDGVGQWNFGDGIVSSLSATDHYFAKPGQYLVSYIYDKYKGFCNGASEVKIVTTGGYVCSLANTPPPGIVDFTFTNAGGDFKYTITNYSKYKGTYTYVWSFGDGTIFRIPPSPFSSSTFGNIYQTEGNVRVTLYAYNGNGCIASNQIQVNVPTNACKKPGFFANDKEFEEDYLPNRKFKYKIWATNAPFYHAVGSKTKSFEKKNGRWKDKKVPEVFASVGGTIYKDECTITETVNDSQSKSNDDKAKCSARCGGTYSLKSGSISSKHYVKEDGIFYNSKRNLSITALF